MVKHVLWLANTPSFGQKVCFDTAPQDLFGEVVRHFGTKEFELCNYTNSPASIADLTYFPDFVCFPKTRHYKVRMYFSHNDLHPDFVVPVSHHDTLATIKDKVVKIKGIYCTWFEPRWGCSLVRPEAPTCAAHFKYPHGFIVHHDGEEEQEEQEEEEEEEKEEEKEEEQEEEQQEEEKQEQQEEEQEEQQQKEEQQEEQQASYASTNTQKSRAKWFCTIC